MIRFLKGALKGYDPKINDWDKPNIRYFDGKKVVGRPTKGFGDPGSEFYYAGKLYKPEMWTPEMETIKKQTELLVYEKLGKIVRFTFCLCGLYKTGDQSIPHHSDTVPTLDDLVVSISFGAPRVFQWREYKQNIKESTNTSETNTKYVNKKSDSLYLLEDGDVIIFDGHSQMKTTHSVPQVIGTEERINLTFRTGL